MSVAVLGTNTEVGKTFISAAIAKCLRDMGVKAVVLKPVETGEPDSKKLIELGVGVESIYRFETPVTPMLAAKLEGKSIDVERLVEECKEVMKDFDFVVVEGVGGVASPIWKNFDSADLASKLKLKSILVSLNELGSITSVVTSAKYLEMKGVGIACVILNKSREDLVCRKNVEIIEEILGVDVVGLPETSVEEAKEILKNYFSTLL